MCGWFGGQRWPTGQMFETPVLNNAVSGKPTVLSMAKQKTKKKKHEIIELHLLVGLAPHFWNHCPKSYLITKVGLLKID